MRRGDAAARLDPQYQELDRRKRIYYANPRYALASLGSLATYVQYGISERANSANLGVPMIRMNNLQANGWDLADLKHIELDDVVLDRYRLLKGDLLFNRTNSKELVGKCEAFDEQGDWVFASYLIRVRLDTSRALPGFVSAFLNSPAGRIQIDQVSRQVAGMSNVNAEELRDLQIPLPSIAEQQRLLNELDTARTARDRALVQADKAINGFEEWALKAMGVDAAQPKRRSTFAVHIGSARNRLDPFHHLPEFIEIERAITSAPHARLGDLVSFSTNTWNPANHPEPTFRYIEISGVDRRRGKAIASAIATDEAPSRARMAVQPGDLIVSLTRPHHGSIALLGPEHQDCVASTGFAVIRKVADRSSTRFLWAVLRLSSSLRQMLRRASGGNYPAITQDQLANILIPLPDINTQQRVIDEAVRRSVEADALEAKAEGVWQQARERFEQQLLKGDFA